jgi:hypothetical protein
MDDQPFRARAEAHIAAFARRTAADHDRLTGALRNRCWPGGPADRTEPVARGWVRAWGPACRHTVALHCTCAQGGCAVCN